MDATPDLSELSLDQLIELERRAAQRDVTTPGEGESDEVVLPWWQHPLNIVTMVVTAALLAAIIGWAVADARHNAHNAVDTGFLQDMRLHHEQAVDMSYRYLDRPDIEPELAVIAASIIQGQTIEIGRIIQMLRTLGEPEAADLARPLMAWMGMPTGIESMPGMASEAELAELDQLSGAAADARFAELMIAHHRGGLHMAEYALEHAESGEVRSFAGSIIRAQTDEIAEIEGQLT